VHAVLATATDAEPGRALAPDQAVAAIESALASDALAGVDSAMTESERLGFVDRTLGALFELADDTGALRLVATPPPGAIVHHIESIQRSL